MQKLINNILIEKPFKDIIGNIEKENIISLAGEKAISGEVFKIISLNNACFKLRICSSIKKAQRIEKNISLFPEAFPKFYGRYKNYLLFEIIEGEHLIKELNQDICYELGKLIGQVHSFNFTNNKTDIDSIFNCSLQYLKLEFTEELINKIINKYYSLKKKVKLEIALEFTDVHRNNFFITKTGRLYFIDEEAFDYKIKGLGFAKPLLTEKWITTEEQKKAFWEGYQKYSDTNYFNKEYEDFLYFTQLIRTISNKLRLKKDCSKQKILLMDFLELHISN